MDTTPVRLPKPKDEEQENVESFFQSESPRLSLMDNKDLYSLFRQFNWSVSSMRDTIRQVKYYCSRMDKDEERYLLRLAVRCIDLTTLSGDDTVTNVERLCYRALTPMIDDDLDEDDDHQHQPHSSQNLKEEEALNQGQQQQPDETIKCAAVCVYPARIVDCQNTLAKLRRNPKDRVKIAAVATGFPSGQYGLKTRLAEVQYALESGSHEIDVVINRAAALAGDWVTVHEELGQMKRIALELPIDDSDTPVHLKVIIGAGDLLVSSPRAIYIASLVAILAGADFVKTSTGKEGVNATLPIGYIMMRCILDYYLITGIRIGFKPAGGIRTAKDALHWLVLLRHLLGPKWLDPELFRFGASGLLDSIVARLKQLPAKKEEN